MDKQLTINISTGTILKIIFWGVLVAAIFYLRDVVLVILTAIVLASFIDLIIEKMTQYRLNWNRTLSVVLIYLTVFMLLAGLFYLFVPVFINEITNLSGVLTALLPASQFLYSLEPETILSAKEVVTGITQNVSIAELVSGIKNSIQGISGGFFNAMISVFGGFVNLVLIIIISFYLSIRERGVENFLRIIIPLSYEDYVISLWNRTEKKIALWIQGQFILGLLVGILVFLGLTILGVQYALLLAVLAALFELIPFGLILAAVPAIFFAYTGGGFPLALWVTGLFVIIQQFENHLLQPLVIKKVVGISPLVVVISILVGAKLAGFWGVILAIPAAVAILEFMEDLERDKVKAKTP